MNKEQLKNRTKTFAVRVIKFVDSLAKSKSNDVVASQIIKSATSVGANYRSACRGRSTAEFISKINIVIEEADESSYWLEILKETNSNINHEEWNSLHKESNELTAIFTATSKTIKSNISKIKI